MLSGARTRAAGDCPFRREAEPSRTRQEDRLPGSNTGQGDRPIGWRERLGGLLNYYYRTAA
jgi:hypothetical protein